MSSYAPRTIKAEPPTTLFTYIQNGIVTRIEIESRQTFMKFRQDGELFRTSQNRHHVKFVLCGLEFEDFFPALSVASSLLRVFERRQFGTGAKRLVMLCPTEETWRLFLFCRLVKFDGKYEGLELGWRNEELDPAQEESTTMHIGYVHHFRNALQRAINWLSPATLVEYQEIAE